MDISKKTATYKNTRLKICGLSRTSDIAYANELKPDYIGFVFAPGSRRYVTPAMAQQLKAQLANDIQAVGVFVNEPLCSIRALIEAGTIDVIQLHGDEDNAYLSALRNITDKPMIQAFRINSRQALSRALASEADYILLDNGGGGTGQTFDWSLIAKIERPYFLAGGLDCNNIAEAITRFHPFAVDVSSGAETDGYKDYHKMKALIQIVDQQNGGNK